MLQACYRLYSNGAWLIPERLTEYYVYFPSHCYGTEAISVPLQDNDEWEATIYIPTDVGVDAMASCYHYQDEAGG